MCACVGVETVKPYNAKVFNHVNGGGVGWGDGGVCFALILT